MKELKEKFLRCKTIPVLSKVDDIHVVTGVLKDFLRNLKEPLLTFSLNRHFMEAAGVFLPLRSDVLLLCRGGGVLVSFSLLTCVCSLSEISDDDNSKAQMYQTIADLQQPNRDTLAYLILHLQK